MNIKDPLGGQSLEEYKRGVLRGSPELALFFDDASDYLERRGVRNPTADNFHEALEEIVPKEPALIKYRQLRKEMLSAIARRWAEMPRGYVGIPELYFTPYLLTQPRFTELTFAHSNGMATPRGLCCSWCTRKPGLFSAFRFEETKSSEDFPMQALPLEILAMILIQMLDEIASTEKGKAMSNGP